jgi:ABC-type Fe3+-siderophore transport system permease subunit
MFPHRFQNSYCGEEVAFLFHFLAFLQYWLVLPAACGGLLSCYLLYLFFQSSDNHDGNNMFISRSALASAYGIAFMLYGSTRFLTVKNCNILDSYMSLLAEQWKRHSNDLCFRWGTTHADSQSASPFATSSSHLLLLVLC